MGEEHRSIGDVLALVQEEFPDVTISKIRFLESQGLLEPERTPSGYRKFYPADIDRLRWILIQQRDRFLPLKVIRERLDEWDRTGTPPADDDPVEPPPPPAGADPAVEPPGETAEPPVDDSVRTAREAATLLAAATAMEVEASRPRPEPDAVSEAGPDPEPDAVSEPEVAVPAETPPVERGDDFAALTAEELAAQGGVDVAVIGELEGYSMIESRRVGPDTYYDPEYLSVVVACRPFLEAGVEIRHLRMYKIAAEREAGVFEQLAMPYLKQRNPEARVRAIETVERLAEVGQALHAELLRHALRSTFH